MSHTSSHCGPLALHRRGRADATARAADSPPRELAPQSSSLYRIVLQHQKAPLSCGRRFGHHSAVLVLRTPVAKSVPKHAQVRVKRSRLDHRDFFGVVCIRAWNACALVHPRRIWARLDEVACILGTLPWRVIAREDRNVQRACWRATNEQRIVSCEGMQRNEAEDRRRRDSECPARAHS